MNVKNNIVNKDAGLIKEYLINKLKSTMNTSLFFILIFYTASLYFLHFYISFYSYFEYLLHLFESNDFEHVYDYIIGEYIPIKLHLIFSIINIFNILFTRPNLKLICFLISWMRNCRVACCSPVKLTKGNFVSGFGSWGRWGTSSGSTCPGTLAPKNFP